MDNSVAARKARIRAIVEKHEPGLAAFVDAAKGPFPEARLTELDVPAAGVAMRTAISGM